MIYTVIIAVFPYFCRLLSLHLVTALMFSLQVLWTSAHLTKSRYMYC